MEASKQGRSLTASEKNILAQFLLQNSHQVIKDCIIQQVIPAIKNKWPATSSKHIIIQQDNAKPHISDKDTDFIEIPHMNKDRLMRNGELPITLDVDEVIVRDSLEFLNQPENATGAEYNILPLQLSMGF
ncbi:hypothetical protein AAHA92_06339 [Salvia divinorum]|uniref:Transposase n=1 Tax=Salvia divinorum TaxID=28513 RepID=A0ABD1I660_SALDI